MVIVRMIQWLVIRARSQFISSTGWVCTSEPLHVCSVRNGVPPRLPTWFSSRMTRVLLRCFHRCEKLFVRSCRACDPLNDIFAIFFFFFFVRFALSNFLPNIVLIKRLIEKSRRRRKTVENGSSYLFASFLYDRFSDKPRPLFRIIYSNLNIKR